MKKLINMICATTKNADNKMMQYLSKWSTVRFEDESSRVILSCNYWKTPPSTFKCGPKWNKAVGLEVFMSHRQKCPPFAMERKQTKTLLCVCAGDLPAMWSLAWLLLQNSASFLTDTQSHLHQCRHTTRWRYTTQRHTNPSADWHQLSIYSSIH